jgi:integrase
MAHGSPQSRAGSFISIRSLISRVVDAWLDDFDLSEQSVRRMVEITERFVQFIEALARAQTAGEVSASLCERFVKAPIADDSEARQPSIATMHLRRATLRLLFRTARDLGLYEGDPTLDLVLPPRTSLKVRALTDEEVALCRSFSLYSLTQTRLPAAWALAEAAARTSEIPYIRKSDVDLENGRVWLHGSSKAEPRWGVPTTWGLSQIKRRVERVGDENCPLIYTGRGSPEAKQSASCIAIAETLMRAGLGSEPDVRPGSVVAWAGARIFEQTGRIEEVARRLGMRSLDRAARFIDFDWKRADGDQE